jgi:hypothetical protein
MAALKRAAALTALANVDIELAMDRLAWDLDLELLSDMGFVEGAAAIGAGMGQGRLVDLVDLFGAGRQTVGLEAVLFAGLADWLARMELGLALGEGSSLAFGGAGCLVELTA